jgi:beta-lactamase class D
LPASRSRDAGGERLRDGRTFIHDDTRAAQRFACASTFKVFNTLIALQEKAITADSVLKWDGRQHDIPDWNRDQTLASAFRVSCVWCYQQMAARVGGDAYRRYIREAGYGSSPSPSTPPPSGWMGRCRSARRSRWRFSSRWSAGNCPSMPKTTPPSRP